MTEANPGAWDQLVRAVAKAVAGELVPIVREGLAGATRTTAPQEQGAERYLSVAETCERFQISRATFDRMLRDTSSGLTEVIVRLPPVTGRVKVPLQAFQAWLGERRQKRRRGRGAEA